MMQIGRKRVIGFMLACLMLFQVGASALAGNIDGKPEAGELTERAAQPSAAVTPSTNYSLWNGEFEPIIAGSGTERDPYLIESAGQLAYLSAMHLFYGALDGATTPLMDVTQPAHYRLTTDIDLNGRPWIAIGNTGGYTSVPFIGYFDGDNHVVQGLNVGRNLPEQGTEAEYYQLDEVTSATIDSVLSGSSAFNLNCGLFGAVGDPAYGATESWPSIENLSVIGSMYTAYDSNYSSDSGAYGGLAGYMHNGTVENCHADISVEGWGIRYVGGLVGRVSGEAVIDTADVTGDIRVNMTNTTISDYYIHGVGGVLGGGSASGLENLTIANCTFAGSIALRGNTTSQDATPGTGGIIGAVSTAGTVLAENCHTESLSLGYNGGERSNTLQNAGGFAGAIWAGATELSGITAGEVEITLSCGANLGEGEPRIENAGGLVGDLRAEYQGSIDVRNCASGGIDIRIDSETEVRDVGGMFGQVHYLDIGYSGFSIRESHVTGDVTIDGGGNPVDTGFVGGFAGDIKLPDENALYMDNCSVTGDVVAVDTAGVSSIGGFAGSLERSGSMDGAVHVKDCRFTGDVYISGEGGWIGTFYEVGGLVGRVHGASLSDCYHRGDMVLTPDCKVGSLNYIGGLIGNGSDIRLERSYALGDIDLSCTEAEGDGAYGIGGLVGYAYLNGPLTECYASGNLTIRADHGDVRQIGGLVGTVNTSWNDPNYRIATSYFVGGMSIRAGGDVDFVGGLLGYFETQPELDRCYVSGPILVSDDHVNIGQFVGGYDPYDRYDDSLDTDCYYDGFYNTPGWPALGDGTDSAGITALDTIRMTRENALNDFGAPGGVDGAAPHMPGYSDSDWRGTANSVETGYYPQIAYFADSADAGIRSDSLKSVETDAYYYVTFDGNGGAMGTGETAVSSWVRYGSAVIGSDYDFTLNGVQVRRWNTLASGNGTGYTLDFIFRIADDATLYAIYTNTPTPPPLGDDDDDDDDDEYTVIFHWNDGRADDEYRRETVRAGDTVDEPTEPERDGFDFLGWYIDPECTLLFDFLAPIQADADVYARWRESLEIVFNSEEHYAYMVGYDDGTVKPNNDITRAEVATIFFRIIEDEEREALWLQENSYSDVGLMDWYNNAVSTMSNGGIFQGYTDGEFKPDNPITRAELAAAVARFVKVDYTGGDYFTDIQGHWAQREINIAAYMGWVTGYDDGTYEPDRNITRAEVAAMINRISDRQPESVDDLLDGMRTWPDNLPRDWFYLDIQEASNSHRFELKNDGVHEYWTELIENRDWTLLERYNSRPGDVYTA